MLFSIIIPIYNAERNLRKCLNSVVGQREDDFELLLIDDGSKDNSGKICDEYVNKYDNIRVIHKKNEGVSIARNIGIECAQGQYLVFIDSDDYIADDYLVNIKKKIISSDPDIIVNSSYFVVDENEQIKTENYRIYGKEVKAEKMLGWLLSRDYPSALWMSTYSRELLMTHKLDENIHFYEDLDFQISLVDSIHQIEVNDDPGYYYRNVSTTHSKFTERTISCYRLIDKLEDKSIPQSKIYILDAEFIISNALIGAQDRSKHKSLDSVLKTRAKVLMKNKAIIKQRKDLYKWILMISISPSLFYMLYRIKHR